MNKTCKKCLVNKNTDKFAKNIKIKSGLHSWCIECCREYHKARYIPKIKPIKTTSLKPVVRPKSIPDTSIPSGYKKCTKCLMVKELSTEFFNIADSKTLRLSSDCKTCRYAYHKRYREKDPAKVKEIQRKSFEKHKKKRKKYTKEYNKKNQARTNANARRKRAEDPLFRVASNLRRAVGGCISRKGFRKNSSLNEYLGCNSQEFKIYIESLFQPGMTWDNYGFCKGKWHLDHIIPLASAKTIEDLYRLSHFTNIQPMWKELNELKSDMMPDEWEIYKKEKKIA